jgi:predicted ribosome quality control (RQC) complex YloA/Tae2 family protein
VKEFQSLVDGKLNKVWLSEGKDLFIQLHIPNKGKTYLRIKIPDFAYITDYKPDMPDKPHGFCLFLRKYLDNARIRSISQLGFERILKIEFEKKEGILNFYAELFSPGNFILTDAANKIMSSLEVQSFKEREVKKGLLYVTPEFKHNFLEIDEAELKELIANSDKESIVKTLAIELGLGGLYAEELLMRAGIDKSKKNLSAKELSELFAKIKELRTLQIKPALIGAEIVPFDILTFKNVNSQPFNTFNEALDHVLTHKSLAEKHEQAHKESSKQLTKEERIIEKQEKQLSVLRQQADENQRKGELLYENYQVVKDILDELNIAKKKYSWKEIKEKLKGHKLVKQINEKDQEVVIEIEEK